ncbi:MAG: GFA family protein [Marinibacterium sp.]|nr:GFA family protein [Marinibacterium sp.]
MTEPVRRRASCHCGAVIIEADLPEDLASARRCDCSFCRRRGAAAVTALTATLRVVQGAENLSLYTWGTGTAKHYFCKTCGIYTHHQRRSDPTESGVNLGAIDGVNPRDLGDLAWVDGVNHPSDRK